MDFFASPTFNIISFVLILGLGAWAAWVTSQLGKVKKQRDALMMKGDKNLEEILNEHAKGLSDHQQDLEMIYKIMDKLNRMSSKSLQKIGVIRFNPFADEGEGGNQSFSVALLDEKDNGFVLSSLFARNETRVYSKSVQGGKSEHHLSTEEVQAISKAQGKLKE